MRMFSRVALLVGVILPLQVLSLDEASAQRVKEQEPQGVRLQAQANYILSLDGRRVGGTLWLEDRVGGKTGTNSRGSEAKPAIRLGMGFDIPRHEPLGASFPLAINPLALSLRLYLKANYGDLTNREKHTGAFFVFTGKSGLARRDNNGLHSWEPFVSGGAGIGGAGKRIDFSITTHYSSLYRSAGGFGIMGVTFNLGFGVIDPKGQPEIAPSRDVTTTTTVASTKTDTSTQTKTTNDASTSSNTGVDSTDTTTTDTTNTQPEAEVEGGPAVAATTTTTTTQPETTTRPESETPPQEVGPPCEEVARHQANILVGSAPSMIENVAQTLAQTCQDESWSAGRRACALQARDADGIEACTRYDRAATPEECKLAATSMATLMDTSGNEALQATISRSIGEDCQKTPWTSGTATCVEQASDAAAADACIQKNAPRSN